MTASYAVTPEKIEAAVKRLIEVARPSRIILFGSAARGDLQEYSDVDLLVVLPEQPESVREVERRIDQAVSDIRMATDILVVSEERLAEVGDRPSVVYREALREGRVVYEAPRMSPRRRGRKKLEPSDAGLPHWWLQHAQRDLRAAQLIYGNDDELLEQACYYAQQAAEKAVEAVLLERNVSFPYTHDLEDLVSEVARRGMTVPPDVTRASELTRCVIDTRYPHSQEITAQDVDDAMRIAEAVVTWAASLVTTPKPSS
jgi:HEPN domain-containing protein/predicted nucleotidyltransferase